MIIKKPKQFLWTNLNEKYISYLFSTYDSLCFYKDLINIYFFNVNTSRYYKDILAYYKKNSYLTNTEINGRVVFINDWDKNVGIVDRIKGILTTYALSKNMNLPFYILWTKPFPLTRYLVPSYVNWLINAETLSFKKRKAISLIFYYSKEKKRNIIGDFMLRHLLKKKKEIHIFTNYNLFSKKSGILFKELFKPSKYLEEAINKNMPGSPYYSYSFRFMQLLGDFKDTYGDILDNEEREGLIKKCLNELAILLKSLPEGYLAFVTSDSKTFLKRVRELDPRIFCIEGEIIHPNTYFKEQIEEPDIYLKTWLDFFLISNAEKVFRLQTDKMYASGFPQLAARVGNKPFTIHEF